MQISAEVQERIKSVEPWMESFPVPTIEGENEYNTVLDRCKEVKAKVREIEGLRTSITQPLNESLRNANAFFKVYIVKLQTYEGGLKRMLTAFDQEQEKKRVEEQRVRDEAARKEKEALEKKADKAESKGDAITADAHRQQAAMTVSTQAQRVNTSKGKGASYRDKYTAVVVDKVAFLRWVLENDRREYVTVNDSLLTKEAQATKGERQWPGVKVTKERIAAVRA